MFTFLKTLKTSFLIALITSLSAQTLVHNSDFAISQGQDYTISGNIGTSPWAVLRSGDDWGARIHDGILELTNTASNAENASGWVFGYLDNSEFETSYNTILGQNPGKLSWYFNMRQIRSNPAGFSSNAYGVGFVLACSDAEVATSGVGYAVVLGNSSSPDPLRLVKFAQGIQSLGSTAEGLIVADTPLDDAKNLFMSILVTFDPATSQWELWGRDDNGSFADPTTGELTLLGTAVDSEFTTHNLSFTGAYWQGSTAGNQTAFFDNVGIWLDSDAAIPIITNILQTPHQGSITPENTVSVSADVVSEDFALVSVSLNWGITESELENTIIMSLESGNTYITATAIPAQLHGTTVFYRIRAENENEMVGYSQVFSYQVLDPDIDVAILSVINPEPLTVDFGTEFESLLLPSDVVVNLDNDTQTLLEVLWMPGNYNPQQAGEYTIEGELVLPIGIINPDLLVAELLIIVLEENSPVGELIVGWTFANETQEADQGLVGNIGRLFSREPDYSGSYTFFSGITDNALSTTGWADGQGSKYWVAEVSTAGYGELTISSQQRSSNTAPRDFKIQYRISTEGPWMDIENGSITVDASFGLGGVDELPLPAACNNKSSLFIRWVMDSDVAVNGNLVAGSGASRIDDVLLMGVFSSDFKRIVTGIENPLKIKVEQGTSFDALELPLTITVFFDDLTSEDLPVTWLQGSYDGNIIGSYQIEGQLSLSAGMENPQEFSPVVEVEVVDQLQVFSVTFSVDMRNVSDFIPENDEVYITGSMFNYSIPGTQPELQLLTSSGGGIFTKILELTEGSYTYKYYVNAGLAYPEPGTDRVVQIESDTIFHDFWGLTTVSQWAQNSIKVYPNPANSHLSISSDDEILQITLVDAAGRSFSFSEINDRHATFELFSFTPGLYALKIFTLQGISTQKVIIKN